MPERMKEFRFYIGIEGTSGQHSVAALCDSRGVVRSAYRLHEPLSLHTTPPELLVERLTLLLREVLHRNNRR